MAYFNQSGEASDEPGRWANFSNLPALDAQTRLLTGRYLEYRVTEKV